MASEFDIWAQLRAIEKSQQALGVQAPVGDFDLDTAWINYGKNGYEYPIANKISKIYVHEDIESFGLSGWLEILDTENLIRGGPIVGQELLYMKFTTAGGSELPQKDRFSVDFTKHPLWIYLVENMAESESNAGGKAPQALTYRLHFCSPELLRNDRVRISQTLQGSYSDILQKILKDHLKTTKTIEMWNTTDLKHMVFPNMHPFDAIDWLTFNSEVNHQVNQFQTSPNAFKGRAADFYFYETTRGYKFLPAMHHPATTITLTLGNAPMTSNYATAMTTSTEYEYSTIADTRQPTPAGLWGSKQIYHDHFNKSVKTYQSNYHRSLRQEQYAYVSKTPIYLPTNQPEKNRDNEDKHISDFPDSLLMLGSFSGKKISNINKNSRQTDYPWSVTPADLNMRREMQTFHACDYNLLTARFPGISSLQAGMVVQLRLPDIGTASGQYDDDPIFHNRLNNWWIIKQVTHVIDNTRAGRSYHCDVLLSNTQRETPKRGILPTYTGMGSDRQFKRTPNKPTFDHPGLA